MARARIPRSLARLDCRAMRSRLWLDKAVRNAYNKREGDGIGIRIARKAECDEDGGGGEA